MAKTPKELAFIRDLYIEADWTRRFTDLIDKHFDLSDSEDVLYINAGTGQHAFSLREKVDEKVTIFATCEDEDSLQIARDKAAAIRSDVDFSMIRFEDDAFDSVIADASFTAEQIRGAGRGSGQSCEDGRQHRRFVGHLRQLWRDIFTALGSVVQRGSRRTRSAAEKLVSEVPTVTMLKEIARRAGLENVQTHTANEAFEYDDGAVFVSSPLVADFLLPVWLTTLDDQDQQRSLINSQSLSTLRTGR